MRTRTVLREHDALFGALNIFESFCHAHRNLPGWQQQHLREESFLSLLAIIFQFFTSLFASIRNV
jgi:hypothetical protein